MTMSIVPILRHYDASSQGNIRLPTSSEDCKPFRPWIPEPGVSTILPIQINDVIREILPPTGYSYMSAKRTRIVPSGGQTR